MGAWIVCNGLFRPGGIARPVLVPVCIHHALSASRVADPESRAELEVEMHAPAREDEVWSVAADVGVARPDDVDDDEDESVAM